MFIATHVFDESARDLAVIGVDALPTGVVGNELKPELPPYIASVYIANPGERATLRGKFRDEEEFSKPAEGDNEAELETRRS